MLLQPTFQVKTLVTGIENTGNQIEIYLFR